MSYLNYLPILYGTGLAILDTVSLPLAKKSKITGNMYYLIIAMIVAATQIGIFYKAMGTVSLVILNLSWDVISDILVTLYGLFILKESLTTKQLLGVFLSIIGIYLMTSNNH